MRRPLPPLLLATVALSGCGGEKAGPKRDVDADAALARVGAKMEKTRNFRGVVELVTTGGGEDTTRVRGRAIESIDGRRSRTRGRFTQGSDATTIEVISVGNAHYVRGRAFRSRLPLGKNWLRWPEDLTDSMAISDFITFIRSSREVKYVGTEEVRGTETDHFRGRLDIKELIKRSGSAGRRALKEIPGVKKLRGTMDLWVRENDRPARMSTTLSGPRDLRIISLVDFLEFNVKASIKAPPAHEVAHVGEFGR